MTLFDKKIAKSKYREQKFLRHLCMLKKFNDCDRNLPLHFNLYYDQQQGERLCQWL